MADNEPNPVGRPLKFKTGATLNRAIDAYFKSRDSHWEYKYDWVKARDSKGQLKKDEHGQNFYEWLKVRRATPQQSYTVSGLARAIGISRDTLIDYRSRPEFIDSIEAAYQRCHEYAEAQLYVNTSGAQFSLKNNWGWEDKKSIDHTTKGQPMPLLGGTTPLPENEDDADQSDDQPSEDSKA